MNYYATARSDAYLESRASFIIKTYIHLFGAVLLFLVIESFWFISGLAAPIAYAMTSVSWLIPLGLFMVASWIASRFAHNSKSLAAQYGGLLMYVVAQSILFIPLLYIAQIFVPGVIGRAALVTLLGTTGLTMIAFYTRKDFSFMGSIIGWGMMCAVLLIVASFIFGFDMGTWFSVAMIALAGGAILYDTSNVIHHFPEDRYVGASLQLFASIALMFWYVLQVMMSLSRND